MTETPEERARRLGLTTGGQEPAAARARRLGLDADDTVEVNASYPERLATTVLKGAQVIPGMKSLEALAGSIGSKFTDTPVSYSDAKAGLEEQTARMGTGRGLLAQAVSSPALAPVMAMRGVSALSPALQGAGYGAAGAALDVNPDETNVSRAFRVVGDGAAGGLLAGTGSGVLKLIKAPPGTAKKALGEALVPNKIQRALKTWRTATTPPEVAKPQLRLNDASAPKAEGFVGNSMDNVLEAVKAQQSAGAAENAVVQAVKRAPTRHRTKAQFDYFADRMAKRAAAEDPNDLTGLLQQSLKLAKDTGKLPVPPNPFLP